MIWMTTKLTLTMLSAQAYGAEDDDDDLQTTKSASRDIPNWGEVVGMIVAGNMESRARSPRGGGQFGRGRSSGGQGHGRSRERERRSTAGRRRSIGGQRDGGHGGVERAAIRQPSGRGDAGQSDMSHTISAPASSIEPISSEPGGHVQFAGPAIIRTNAEPRPTRVPSSPKCQGALPARPSGTES